jgi:hypothetical protein
VRPSGAVLAPQFARYVGTGGLARAGRPGQARRCPSRRRRRPPTVGKAGDLLRTEQAWGVAPCKGVAERPPGQGGRSRRGHHLAADSIKILSGPWGRLALLCGRVGDKLRSACRAAAGRLRQAARAARWAWQLVGERVRAALLAGAGVAAASAAYLARTSLADAARRLWGGAKALAGRAWGALRRALPALGLCGT